MLSACAPKIKSALLRAVFARNRREINVGKVKLLRLVQRLSPALADRILRNS